MAIVIALLAAWFGPTVFAKTVADDAPAATVLLFGDSLTAGFGLAPGEGWADLLAERLARRTTPWRVVNASVSGETTTGGRTRLPRALAKHSPRVLVLELGGNDGLRGTPLTRTREHLAAMIALGHEAGAEVVLLGIRIPPNYGPEYAAEFDAVFAELAAREDVHFVPFLLEGVALDMSLMQADGIHPTAAAQPHLLETAWPAIAAALEAARIRQD